VAFSAGRKFCSANAGDLKAAISAKMLKSIAAKSSDRLCLGVDHRGKFGAFLR
jgi:hypothetical protein